MQITPNYNTTSLTPKPSDVINNIKKLDGNKEEAALKAAKEFEAVFLTSMIENMYTGVETSKPFGGGHAEKVFRSMQISEYAKSMSENGGIGIAEHVYREILALQESGSK